MSNSVTCQSDIAGEPAAHGVVATWGPWTLVALAIVYAASSFFSTPQTTLQVGSPQSAMQPFVLFCIGLAPIFGAALVVWTSRHGLSPQERRSQLVGAAMSAVLFFPAMLLARFFG